jgi:hypothetical protein
MGGGGKSPSYTPPVVDNSAQIKAAEEAAKAEAEEKRLKEEEEQRKKNVAEQGRKSTILAGDGENGPGTLLGG